MRRVKADAFPMEYQMRHTLGESAYKEKKSLPDDATAAQPRLTEKLATYITGGQPPLNVCHVSVATSPRLKITQTHTSHTSLRKPFDSFKPTHQSPKCSSQSSPLSPF